MKYIFLMVLALTVYKTEIIFEIEKEWLPVKNQDLPGLINKYEQFCQISSLKQLITFPTP